MSGKNFRFQDNVLYLFQPAGHVSCTSYHGCEPLWLILGLTLTVQPNGKYPYWPSRWTAVWSLGPNPVWIEREFARFEFLRKKRISKSFFFFFTFVICEVHILKIMWMFLLWQVFEWKKERKCWQNYQSAWLMTLKTLHVSWNFHPKLVDKPAISAPLPMVKKK